MVLTRKVVRRENPRRRLGAMMAAWDDAVCQPPDGTLGEADRIAASIVAEVTRQGMRPPTFPGSWRGFIDWCERRRVKGASGLWAVKA